MSRMLKVLAAAFVAGAAAHMPRSAWADTWTDNDDHVWAYTVNGDTATVTNVFGAEYDMVIPATLGGKTVVSFGTVFKGNTKISEVVIPDSVTAIDANAFNGCSQLQQVTVGANVASVGANAFRNCSLLQKIELPAATTALGTGAFAYCEKMNTAKITGVTSIPGSDSKSGYTPTGGNSTYFKGYGAFYGCEKLRTLELGDNLTFIGNGAFYECKELYDVVIPDSVTNIGWYAFADCTKLHSLTVGDGVVKIGQNAFRNDTELEILTFKGTALRKLGAEVFYNCQNLQSLDLPEGLEAIGAWCFSKCESIPAVVMPDSITNCDVGAFADCASLRRVEFGAGLTYIAGAEDKPGYTPGGGNSTYFKGYGAFYGCTALTEILFNASLKTIGRGAFYGCKALPEITIPENVTTIGDYAFAECNLLKAATIGDRVRLIGDGAFYNDTTLETLILGAKVQTLEESVFENCVALKSFDFPDSVLSIGAWSFKNCKALTSVILPDRVGRIGFGTFAYCTGLTDVTIGTDLEEIPGAEDKAGYTPGGGNSTYFKGYGAFYGCTSLKNVLMGQSVATIGRGAFYECSALPSIVIPSSVSTIDDYAFSKCSSLSSVDIKDDGVTSIGDYAFSEDAALTTALLGNRLVKIGEGAFYKCTKLTGLVLPATLITLDNWCFRECQSIESIVIPDKVKDLNPGAFCECTALKKVSIGSTLLAIGGAEEKSGYTPTGGNSTYFKGYGAFYGCTALTDVDLGDALAEIQRGAFYGCTALRSIVIPDSVTTIRAYAFANCTSLIKATMGAGVATMGDCVFAGDTALHYVEFKGNAAPANVGSGIFEDTPAERMARKTVYVKEGSTGWAGLYQPGLPGSGTWCGVKIAYAPPPEGADNPYDFYPVAATYRKNSRNYTWATSFLLTTNRYENSTTVPSFVSTIREGSSVYLSYAFDVCWRGAAFDVTNRFTLSGAKSGTFDMAFKKFAHSTAGYFWETNAVPALLQNLAAGKYTLTLQLNAGNRLPETDYSSNTTSITFTVVATPKYTVKFSLNGVSGTTPAARTIREGNVVGSLPSVKVPSDKEFLGWFTAKRGGTKVTAKTVVKGNMTIYAQWVDVWMVKFNANGGKVSETKRTVKKGKTVGSLPKATRTGYTLKGWYTKKSGGSKITTKTKIAKNVTYYAQWTANKYKIKFNANGGKGSMKTLSATYGKNVTLRANAFKRTGYKFAGWAKTKKGKVVYKNKAKVKNLTATKGKTVTLYAVWKKAKASSVKSAAMSAPTVPAWAVGTFYGGDSSLATITVSASGKVGGSVLFADGAWTIDGTVDGLCIRAVMTNEDGDGAVVVFAIKELDGGGCRIESEDGSIWAERML